MCKYTIYSYECGDPAEDHVDTKDCIEFQRIGVHCDRDNPANKGRVKVAAKTRNGICARCLRKEQENDEIAAMERELERAKEESRLEARQREEDMRRAEQKIHEESFADYARRKAALAAETAAVERQTKGKYDEEMRQKEQEHLNFMLKKSAEDELKRQRAEHEELQKALIESLKIDDSPIEYHDEVIMTSKKDLSGGVEVEWQTTKTEKTTITRSDRTTASAASTPPPAPAPTAGAIPPPPPPPPAPKAPSVQRAPAPPKQGPPQPRSWNLPAVGEQQIGHLKIGNRAQPIHPSQKLQPTSPAKPVSPTGPAHEGRLRGIIAPDVPTLRQAQGQLPTADSTAGYRRTSVTRRTSGPPTAEPHVDPQLQKLLDKRRRWEDEEEQKEEENSSTLSITPSQSASNVGTQASTPAASLLKKPNVVAASPTVASEDAEDASVLQARRLNMSDFDMQRRAGWTGESKH